MGAKLLLEGKEVPFIGATITCAVNQASIAYVDLVPHQSINDIKPRTLVQIFVRQFQDEGPKCVFPYILAWEGEVFGYSFGKTPSSRSFSISCIDITSYWDNVLAYYFNGEQSMGSGAIQLGSQANIVNDIKVTGERLVPVVQSQASYFKKKIDETLKDTTKDFLDAVGAIYADIGKVNDFFYNAEDRLRIRDRIVMRSSGSLTKLVDETVAMSWFSDLPGRSSGFTSLRFILQDLLAIIFHDTVTIPFPAAVDAGTFLDPKKDGITLPSKKKKTIGSFVFKPNLYMLPPPMCNVFFPDEYSSFQYSRNFFKEPTRMTYQPEIPAMYGQGAAAVFMPCVYQPPSFHAYMKSSKPVSWDNYRGTGGIGIPKNSKDPGRYYDEDTDPKFKDVNSGLKREQQFLTSEERIQGIVHARESMIPASSSFRMALDDYNDMKNTFSKNIAQYLFYKKRFQDRTLQITSHLKMSVVPGFPVLLLDDSDADQNIVAYCTSVTHRIYATEGGYTNVQLTYARHIAEQDKAGTAGATYMVPPWFAEEIFGTFTWPKKKGEEATKEETAKIGLTVVPGAKLAEFYEALLGDRGSKPVTSVQPNEDALTGSVRGLINEYKKRKASGVRDVQQYIYIATARRYIRMKSAMQFISASTKTDDIENASWIEFIGSPFTRKGEVDEEAVALRGSIITKYRDILKSQRGFRG